MTGSDIAAELAAIREQVMTKMTANEDDTTLDLVRRMMSISWGEGSATQWFERWQKAHRMNRRLIEALSALLTLAVEEEMPPDDMFAAMSELLIEASAPMFGGGPVDA